MWAILVVWIFLPCVFCVDLYFPLSCAGSAVALHVERLLLLFLHFDVICAKCGHRWTDERHQAGDEMDEEELTTIDDRVSTRQLLEVICMLRVFLLVNRGYNVRSARILHTSTFVEVLLIDVLVLFFDTVNVI